MPGARRRRVLAFVDLVQDFDVLAPVLRAAKSHSGLRMRVVVSRWLAKVAPRVEASLRDEGLSFSYVRRADVIAGKAPSLAGHDILLAASESSADTHTAGHALALRARQAGLATYVLQHGFEHVGLTLADDPPVTFASDQVLCWHPKGFALPGVAATTVGKLIRVGRPASFADEQPAYDVGVFENLHWHRYTDADRDLFMDNLTALAAACPDLKLYARAHPAGAWLDRHAEALAAFANLTIVSGEAARREAVTGAQVVSRMARIITTPSTVALDAAQASRPVALALAGGPIYDPLPVLQDAEDWIAFARATPDLAPGRVLVARAVAPGDAVSRILALFANEKTAPPSAVL